MPSLTRDEFVSLALGGAARAARERRAGQGGLARPPRVVIPLAVRLLSDQLTPVVAYRRLVAQDARTAPSFLLESVENGERQGRYSIMGAQPAKEVVARAGRFRSTTHGGPTSAVARMVDEGDSDDPLALVKRSTEDIVFVRPPERIGAALPSCALGGWFGYAAYDAVRYAEPSKLGFERAPRDDRALPDVHFAYYPGVVVFDHAERVMHVVRLAEVAPPPSRSGPSDDEEVALHARAAYDEAIEALERVVKRLQTFDPAQAAHFTAGRLPGRVRSKPVTHTSNITREQHARMVARAKDYIASGDVFQVVLGQRFERRSNADPFDVYRALRAVNPSPYMVYLQAEGCILAGSSPEILCRVRREGRTGDFVVTNRPLAGTRKRGDTPEADAALERELLDDPKERAEHIMLVDLGRNDVGRVARPGSVALESLMQVERYSHVMHISSTVTGRLREGLDCWDALRAALPAGTITGAPKVRAMQVIDELEPLRRGPYGGGMGYVSPEGEMDIALTLRTLVIPTALRDQGDPQGEWMYHLQSAGGIVADSDAGAEYDETVNKAAALGRAIDLAEEAF